MKIDQTQFTLAAFEYLKQAGILFEDENPEDNEIYNESDKLNTQHLAQLLEKLYQQGKKDQMKELNEASKNDEEE